MTLDNLTTGIRYTVAPEDCIIDKFILEEESIILPHGEVIYFPNKTVAELTWCCIFDCLRAGCTYLMFDGRNEAHLMGYEEDAI